MTRTCEVPGCPNRYQASGLCAAHRRRKSRYGDPLAPELLRAFTPREDELLVSLPTKGPTGRVKNGGIAELAIALGRHPHGLSHRRRLLLSRKARGAPQAPLSG